MPVLSPPDSDAVSELSEDAGEPLLRCGCGLSPFVAVAAAAATSAPAAPFPPFGLAFAAAAFLIATAVKGMVRCSVVSSNKRAEVLVGGLLLAPAAAWAKAEAGGDESIKACSKVMTLGRTGWMAS